MLAQPGRVHALLDRKSPRRAVEGEVKEIQQQLKNKRVPWRSGKGLRLFQRGKKCYIARKFCGGRTNRDPM